MKSFKDLKKWEWVIYPIGVVIIMFLSLQYLAGNQMLMQMSDRQKKVDEQMQLVTVLQNKLARLQQSDEDTIKRNIIYLEMVVPIRADLSLILKEVRTAANEGGMNVISYRSLGEENKISVTLKSDNIKNLQSVLTVLENMVPVVSISRVDYKLGTVDVTVEGAYNLTASAAAILSSPLPDAELELSKVKNLTSNYRVVLGSENNSTGSANQNPF